MRYTVEWEPTARAELANLWVSAIDRQAITDAADRIDRRLMYSPETAGAEYGDDRWLRDDPLAVLFTVFPNARLVKVLHVWIW